MHCIMLNCKRNSQVCINCLAYLNVDQCVELAFIEGMFERFGMLTFLKSSLLKVLNIKGKVNVDATQMRIFFSFCLFFYPYHNKSTQFALKECSILHNGSCFHLLESV